MLRCLLCRKKQRTMLRRLSSPFAKFNRTQSNGLKYKSTNTAASSSPVETSSNDGGEAQSTKPAGVGKLNARGPLAKNFFIGMVDKELLGFPEVITRDDLKRLQNEVLPLKNFFAEQVDGSSIDATRTVPPEVFEGVRELGLYGINVPEQYGGKGWQWSQSLLASEPEASCADVALSLLSHRVIVDVLNEIGTEEQKTNFLHKLANGSTLATEAIYEEILPEFSYFNTTAEYNPEKQSWLLNGNKSFVITMPQSSGTTHMFLVIAQTDRLNTRGDASRGTTIFLVDSSKAGVQLEQQHLTFGCRGVKSTRVRFENVELANSLVLGTAHEGNAAADVILRAGRLRHSLIGLVMSKDVLNEMSQYMMETKHCGVSLNDMELNQSHVSKALCATYAVESMVYMTGGLLDEFKAQDVALEAAITKYFTMRQLFKISTKAMDIIGSKSLLSGQSTEVALRNSAQLYTQGESMDSLRLFIAITGLQHAGVHMEDIVRKGRNPLYHPAHIFGKFMQQSSIDNPKTRMRLSDSLHPTLEPAAQCLEHSVARLQMCVELLLTRYGSDVVQRHNDMLRLTEMSTAIYAMFASVSRASRSYCIGQQLADHEMLMASAICTHGRDKVKSLCSEVFNGQYLNNDNILLRLSSQVTKSKGYFAVHPLTYNY